ncbi:MAG: polysaccharide deacetylase family protein [Ferruginibacter sp.]
MDPDSADADKYFSILINGLNPFPFLTSTISCSLLLLSCHSSPDEKLVKLIVERKDSTKTAPVITAVAKPKKKIYLTFDDGPNKGTGNVMNILKDEDVPATLFIIGQQVFGSRAQHALWDSLLTCSNIELANHSYSHAHNHYADFYTDPQDVVNDFEKCKDTLQLSNSLARTPGRNTWRLNNLSVTDLDKTKAAADSMQQAGFNLIGWDVEWHFNPPNLSLTETADVMLQRIDSMLVNNKTKNYNHIILLAHDQTFADTKDSTSLRYLIQQLKRREDYELKLVSNYPGIN